MARAVRVAIVIVVEQACRATVGYKYLCGFNVYHSHKAGRVTQVYIINEKDGEKGRRRRVVVKSRHCTKLFFPRQSDTGDLCSSHANVQLYGIMH